MSAETPGPLVGKKWVALWGSVGLGLAVYAQAWAPLELVGVAAAAASVALYAATGELPQPELLKRVGVLVPAGLVPSLGLLATGVHTWAVDAKQPLLHVLGTLLAVITGTVRQPTVGLKNGVDRREPPAWVKSMLPGKYGPGGGALLVLLLAGSLQGCATTRMLAEQPPEDVPHALAPGLTADVLKDDLAKECRHTYFWRFFAGLVSDGCTTLAGGAAGGTVLAADGDKRWFAVGGAGFLVCSKVAGNAHAELSARYAEICRGKK